MGEHLQVLPPLGLYVHLPWCVRRCPYCDFNSHVSRGEPPFADYVSALIDDLETDLPLVEGRTVETVFFGGGTPSLCPPELLARFMERLSRLVPVAARAEVTLEANPGTVERGRFSELAAAGINRVSLGVQSFQAELLRAIGRIHDEHEAYAAIEELAKAGMRAVNLDLMYGLPGQSIATALADIVAALRAGPSHLSLYQLTLEPGTPFHKKPPALPDDEACWEMECLAAEQLAAAGYQRYEVSAWAVPGEECRHNLNYWTYGDYLGIGAGAHSKLTLPGGAVLRRQRKTRPLDWLRGPRLESEERPDDETILFEFMLNALRLTGGFRLAWLEERTGLPSARVLDRLRQGARRGLLHEEGPGEWRPTALGLRFLNELQALFLPGT